MAIKYVAQIWNEKTQKCKSFETLDKAIQWITTQIQTEPIIRGIGIYVKTGTIVVGRGYNSTGYHLMCEIF